MRAYDGELAEGIVDVESALEINPNQADAWSVLADLTVFDGRPLEAIELMQTAFRLNPHPPGFYYTALGWSQYAAAMFSEAAETLSRNAVLGAAPRRILAAALAQLGRLDEARREALAFLASAPTFTVGEWGRNRPFKHDADRQRFISGFVKAGLPM